MNNISVYQIIKLLINFNKNYILVQFMLSKLYLSPQQDYIVKRLQQENDQITEDERLIQKYREDTCKKKLQIEELKTS